MPTTCSLGKDVPIGFYHSLDDIESFKIRVCVRKIVPVPMQYELMSTNVSTTELKQFSGKRSDTAERTISWQEKISKEDVRNKNQLPCSTIEETEKGAQKIELFTEVTSKLPQQNSEDRDGQTRGKDRVLRHRNQFCPTKKSFQLPHFLNAKELVKTGLPRLKVADFITMAILASISYENGEDEEMHLCMVMHNARGDLIVIPDFRKSPYYIRSSRLETYEFTLEHASKGMIPHEVNQEKHFLSQVSQHHMEAIESIIGTSFDMPPPNYGLWYLNGELILAELPFQKNIFLTYRFELSKDLSSENSEILSGSTHTCRAKKKDNGYVAYFGFPFSLSLLVDTQDYKIKVPSLKIFIEITSMDSWGVCRNEGNGLYVIPFVPGFSCDSIQTWKLIPQGLLDKLKNFFLGTASYLDDSYTRIPQEDILHSRYGAKTEASGSVSLQFHSVFHFTSQAGPHYLIYEQEVTSNH